MSEKVRLASLGLGWWGSLLADGADRSGVAEIVTCYARRSESREDFSRPRECRTSDSAEALLADPEVEGVIIATAHDSHRELVEMSAAAGKHIFIEKPLANTVADARACIEAAEAAGVLLQVGHQRRRQEANRRIKEMIDSGELGDIQTVTSHQSTPYGFSMAADAWRWDTGQSPLGSMTSMGVHLIDTMHYLIGPIVKVMTMSRTGRDRTVDEATIMGFEFESGALATLATSFFTPSINEVAVFGTEGAAYNQRDGAILSFQGRNDDRPTQIPVEPVDLIADQLREFALAIRGGATVEVGGPEGLAVVAVMEAAIEAAASGRTVDVVSV